jgi:hypothetical protein
MRCGRARPFGSEHRRIFLAIWRDGVSGPRRRFFELPSNAEADRSARIRLLGSLDQNELDLLPRRAAGLEHLLDPTPFSFADPHYLRATLAKAGFTDIRIGAYDQAVTSGDLDAMTTILLKVGPLGRIVRENPELRPSAETRVRAALATKGDLTRVALRAATWVVSAGA